MFCVYICDANSPTFRRMIASTESAYDALVIALVNFHSSPSVCSGPYESVPLYSVLAKRFISRIENDFGPDIVALVRSRIENSKDSTL